MSGDEEKMMHYLWMIGNRYISGYEDWAVTGFPVNPPSQFLGWNSAQ